MPEKQQISEALRAALAKREDGQALDRLIAGELNAAGWVVKDIAVIAFDGGSYAVSVSNDGRAITVEVQL